MSVLRVAFLSSFMLELISAVSIAIVAVISGFRLLHGTMAFSPAYFILLVAPEYFLTLRTLGTFYHSRMEAMSAAEQISAFLETRGGYVARSGRPGRCRSARRAPSPSSPCLFPTTEACPFRRTLSSARRTGRVDGDERRRQVYDREPASRVHRRGSGAGAGRRRPACRGGRR